MIALKIILSSLHVLVSIVLVVIILLQASKGGGLAGITGGQTTTALFGARGTASALSTITQYVAATFLVLSLLLSLLAGAGQKTESVTQKVLQQTPASQLPAVETLNFGTEPAEEDFETVPVEGEEATDEP